jgi:hypothetical protein
MTSNTFKKSQVGAIAPTRVELVIENGAKKHQVQAALKLEKGNIK